MFFRNRNVTSKKKEVSALSTTICSNTNNNNSNLSRVTLNTVNKLNFAKGKKPG